MLKWRKIHDAYRNQHTTAIFSWTISLFPLVFSPHPLSSNSSHVNKMSASVAMDSWASHLFCLSLEYPTFQLQLIIEFSQVWIAWCTCHNAKDETNCFPLYIGYATWCCKKIFTASCGISTWWKMRNLTQITIFADCIVCNIKHTKKKWIIGIILVAPYKIVFKERLKTC